MTADLVVDTAAVWRLTRLVTRDELTRPLREWIWDNHPDSHLAYMVGCPWCVSVWMAAAVRLARSTAPHWWQPAAFVLAASTVAGLLEDRLPT